MTLLDLKRIAARRVPQVMAVALGKGWNNADVRFRPSPSGPTEQPALVVTPSHQAVSMLSKESLDCELLCRPEPHSNGSGLPVWKVGTNLGAAREKVRVAHALKNLPQISDAFSKGKVSYSKVRAMTRVATPENEEFLMTIARHGTARHVEQLVRHYRSVKRREALERDNQRHERRSLSVQVDTDG